MTRVPAPLALAVWALTLAPAVAQDRPPPFHDAGRALAEQFADTLDADGDGVIAPAEMSAFGADVFASMDRAGDGAVDLQEMAAWRYGMADLAAFRDRTEAFDTTVALVFDIFDRDDDGALTRAEHDDAVARSVAYADRDGDGVLTRDEYLSGFIFNVAMRNALVRRAD